MTTDPTQTPPVNPLGRFLSPQAQRVHERCQNDLPYFCARMLRVKLKEGGTAPFVLNKAQMYLHERIEKQLHTTGKVRMLILKGRQQGISTYIAARFYHKATRHRGKNVFILSHHATTTETLFQIVDKYHANCPPEITPRCLVSNNRRMRFDNGSQYTVGTAGSGSIGRGDTNQYLHWSEVAFSENIPELLTGLFQTVSDMPGTEKILESTANGVGNYFHRACMDALSEDDDYELVFIPWFWQDEYRSPLKPGFTLTDEEHQLQQMYGLDDLQIQWRRNKIDEFKKEGFGERKFKQEYPCTVKEAFQSSGEVLFDPDKVAAARKSRLTDPHMPIIIGADLAPIHDRNVLMWRQGRHCLRKEVFMQCSQMDMVGKIAARIDKHKVAKVFIDVAEGRGAVDRLHELGYRDVVMGIHFGMAPIDDRVYSNKRAEMAGLLKDWVEDDFGARIPDDDELEVEFGVIPDFKQQSNGRKQLVPKDKIKETYGKSPDLIDALMLTFAQPVRSTYNQTSRITKAFKRSPSEIHATNRRAAKAFQTDDYDDDDFPKTATGFKRISELRRL